MKLSEVGEFPLIARLARLLDEPYPAVFPTGPGLRVGIGDDAAVWSPPTDVLQVITTDALVEGVHFDPRILGWRDLGWKSIVVNVSDVAAMGALPRYALVSMGVRREQEVEDIEELYLGMKDALAAYGMRLVGGDTTSSPVTMLSVTVVGETGPGEKDLLLRSTGRPGDRLAVTGWLGSSAAGLRLLLSGTAKPEVADHRVLVEAHRRPVARVDAARIVLKQGVRCGMDISDGLLGDTTRVCEASRTGAILRIDRLPVHPALRRVFPQEAEDLALAGGEDYELLVAAPAEVLERAASRLHAELGLQLTQVGELTPPPERGPLVRVLDPTGKEYTPRLQSWQHFATA